MNNKVLIAIIVIIVLLGLGYFLSQSGNKQVTQPAPANSPEQASASAAPAVKTFDVTGTPFKFEPNEMKVKKGDTVRINFKNMEGFHDLTIADLNIKTKQIQAGQTDTVEFVADRAGTFDMMCSVPTHADKGMVGKFIVEE